MKRARLLFQGHWVFAKCPENPEEEKELDKLARETRAICSKGIRTGLWIAAEFRIEDRTILVTNLEQPLKLSQLDLDHLRTAVTAKLQEAS